MSRSANIPNLTNSNLSHPTAQYSLLSIVHPCYCSVYINIAPTVVRSHHQASSSRHINYCISSRLPSNFVHFVALFRLIYPNPARLVTPLPSSCIFLFYLSTCVLPSCPQLFSHTIPSCRENAGSLSTGHQICPHHH